MEKNENASPNSENGVNNEEVKKENPNEAPPSTEREELLAEISSWQEQYNKALMTAAHHENLSRLYKGDYDRLNKYRSQPLIEKLLPTLDSFQMAFAMPTTPEVENFRMGFDFIYKLIRGVLENEGVTEIVPKVGESYDLSAHQAIETVDTLDPKKDKTIASVLLSGYRYKERILRAANVKMYQLKVEDSKKETSAEEPKVDNH
jgi:molecular chaperone GrpE